MNVLVDTSIWSLALCKKTISSFEENVLNKFKELISEHRVKIIGPIRQETLSGISQSTQFNKLRIALSAFEDIPIESYNYERAAEMYNLCRKNGIQGSQVDYLICSVAESHSLSIFTLDQDFQLYSKHIPILLFMKTNF